ncbi:haemolysin-like protein : HlyJ haemolysin-like protein OS=Pseudomonas aeruginosa GN=hlyJ PE=4 SV=1: TPR_16 [Gemmata massiliana]|uniref:EF-hand domain-containing protein n=1 Tax=Gemmata massiliana TaxID=1210884 RepID=A0A6P2DHK5_9BACT|nr:tetratricopeptide repeat protein [Gemmata massiliana]VTS02346.1 haemolysin-like protein : HlyJ haemolysin-like protein OS=Pseudomonas aeruginosa GN=hlyJ PE=4 SV=1: TPR_16 [Gemmata massiliana]
MPRFCFKLVLALIALGTVAEGARAIYMRVETDKVPVGRLAKNLEEVVKKNPKDANAILNLARVHAMAYSLRSEDVPVDKKAPDSIWFGYESPFVPFRSVAKVDDKEKLKAAQEHLKTAIKLYEDAIKLAPDDLRAKLGHAWLLSQTDKNDDAIKALREVIDEGWKKDKDLKALGLGGHTITAEGAGYLIPLLDKEKDKDEIATLTERVSTLKKLPRPVTPIAVPLKDGLTAIDLEDRNASVAFDADGTGLQKKWTWISAHAAWLVHDPKRSGKITSALQMFGGVTFWLFWETGYDALASLDDNGDGVIADKELEGLSLWHDANGNGVCDPGEVKPLSEHGIVSLSCKFTRDPKHPDRIAYSKVGATFRDGATRPTFDLVLHPAKK